MGKLDSLYARLPVAVQHAAVSAFGLYWYRLRYGGDFDRFVREYRKRDRLPAEAWSAYQRVRLASVLRAALNAPYYQRSWSREQKQRALAGDLSELPLLEKRSIRADALDFVRTDSVPPSTFIFHTSGSTGTPIATIWTAREVQESVAVREVRSLGWAGVSYAMPRATFSGRMVEPDPDSGGPFYRFNAVERQAYLSPFHLRPDTAEAYVRAINRHGIQWLTGYAVSYFLLAQFMIAAGIPPPSSLQAIITTSEKLTPDMRRTMERAFGCRVWEEYSTVENSLFVSECEFVSSGV